MINGLMTISCWNVNGWTNNNCELRKTIITGINSDIVCITETHLENPDGIIFEGYTWYGHNRLYRNRNAPKASGGVGVLIKNCICNMCNIDIDKSIDGVLCIGISNTSKTISMCIVVCYLSPESSVWGRDANSYFAHLLSIVYLTSEYEHLIICGDLNARVGTLEDCIQEVDNILPRSVIDNTRAGHHECLIDFLKDTKTCITNGRITPENDNFTCISGRGKSVVDYFIVPHNNLDKCIELTVSLTSDLINQHGALQLISETCKPPDHSVLTLSYQCGADLHGFNPDQYIVQGDVDQTPNSATNKKYKFDNVPPNFMNNNNWRETIDQMINTIHQSRIDQDNINNMYDQICVRIFSEMDTYLETSKTGATTKRFKNNKPYWSKQLTDLLEGHECC